ncbi:hypothetical protein SAMD00019534_103830 [Acytostelium subglobosum LB1]|uniref:hypothetical protein n=1 Tax=Acytostelium subglobosum LB1 TaxID=1410327 RepID=UPI000644DB8E|nr:hypothetical protein SAMD00019534_103830 [Acytostelium subglobosum LB1]GAM27208.1 hypothetical protein SAMD00019534_103830 [Acytostelium subglobosum LB1]|eukprot:XP_012749675.1 hypothetical protein SAMD00019534_103830 [Acytostelium subglobosum LB1]
MISNFDGPTPKERFLSKTLAEYSDGDLEFENELITSYIGSVKEHLPQLEASLKKRDEKDSILHSHDIKGSSSYIGAEAVRFLSGKMEAYCKEGQLEKAEEYFDELSAEVDQLFILLEKHIGVESSVVVSSTAPEVVAADEAASESQSESEKKISGTSKEKKEIRKTEVDPNDDGEYEEEVTITLVDDHSKKQVTPDKRSSTSTYTTTSNNNNSASSCKNSGNVRQQSPGSYGSAISSVYPSSSRDKLSREYPLGAQPTSPFTTSKGNNSTIEKSGGSSSGSCGVKLREAVYLGASSVANH